jgi:hypothetical protein
MHKCQLKTAVAFIIFNRPDCTQLVFNEIAKAKPSKLFIIGDGPRKGRLGEVQKVMESRSIISQVDWQCEVITNYSDINLGCKVRVSSGLDWVFNQVDQAIILEDDCLPNPTFFQFCEVMLEKYQNDTRVAQISGVNFNLDSEKIGDSYFFSKYNPIWGWATWRRSWLDYDVEMKTWPILRSNKRVRGIFNKKKIQRYWTSIFDLTYEGRIDTWDYQWTFSCLFNSKLSILPKFNLISNIGFGAEATHTKKENKLTAMKTENMKFPLMHPDAVLADNLQDKFLESVYMPTSISSIKNVFINLARNIK